MPIVSMKSDLHPYECGQNCVHCRKAVEGDHNPFTCVFCTPALEDVVPIEQQLVSRLSDGPFRAVDEADPVNVKAAELANALLNSGLLGSVTLDEIAAEIAKGWS